MFLENMRESVRNQGFENVIHQLYYWRDALEEIAILASEEERKYINATRILIMNTITVLFEDEHG